MKPNAIILYDSGIGGLSIYQSLQRKIPEKRIVYIADGGHFPYGEKSEDEIIRFGFEIIENVRTRFEIAVFVIACNTASVVQLPHLRKQYSFPIVGTVPAVKVASEKTKNQRIGVIATDITAKKEYLKNLIRQVASNCEVIVKSTPLMVDMAEKPWLYPDRLERMKEELAIFIEKRVDYLVLGCTHFSFLEKEIRILLGDEINVVDSRDGVSNQVLRLLPKSDSLERKTDEKNLYYYTDQKKKADIKFLKNFLHDFPSLTLAGRFNLFQDF